MIIVELYLIVMACANMYLRFKQWNIHNNGKLVIQIVDIDVYRTVYVSRKLSKVIK